MLKITLVGAGSVVFSKNLVCDILQYAALEEATLCLMDIHAGRLEVIGKLVRRIVAQLGVKARVETTTDLRQACTGARFVITTIQVGGYKPSTVVDFEIPARYGVQQTIADTLGVGGVFRALRSIPKLVEVARMVQEVGAPNPLLLNYTNPMAMNMWAIDKITALPSVGLCHSVQGTSRQIAGYCGLDPRKVSYTVAGINHMAFFLRFEYNGKDAYPLLFRAMEDPGAYGCDRVRFEMMRRLGYFVTESSEHQSEYVPYFIHHGEEEIAKFRIPINEYIRRCESMEGRWDLVERELLDESRPVEIGRSVEYGSTIINSIVSGEPSVIYGNVPNTGLITNLTQGCSVEVPCLVDRQGISPTWIGELPPQLAAIIHTNLNVQELTVEAARTGRRDYIYQAVMMDPHTSSVLPLDKIWAMCDDLIEAHQRDGMLGEFEPVVRNTGKPLASVARVFLSIEPEGVPFVGEEREAAFKLVAENETAECFEGEVTIAVRGADGAEVLPSPRLTVKVEAGARQEVPFSVCRGEAPFEGELSIGSPSLRTVERDLAFPKRNQHEIPVDATGERRLPFQVEWSGNRVADGTLWLTPETVELEVAVDDTDLRTDPCYFDGSAVEIALRDPAKAATPEPPLVVFPDEANPRVMIDSWFTEGRPYDGATAKVHRDASGYVLRLSVDRAKAGIASGPFLCDMIFHVNALGTAHGKIAASWQGSHALRAGAIHYALLIPTA